MINRIREKVIAGALGVVGFNRFVSAILSKSILFYDPDVYLMLNTLASLPSDRLRDLAAELSISRFDNSRLLEAQSFLIMFLERLAFSKLQEEARNASRGQRSD